MNIRKKLDKINKLKGWSANIADSALNSPYLNGKSDTFCSSTGLTKEDLTEKFERMSTCSDVITIEKTKDFDDILNANYCKQQTVCPICADRATNKRFGKYSSYIIDCAEKYRYAYMITFTVAESDSLHDQNRHLNESLKKFRKMGQKRKEKNDLGEWGKVEAGLVAFEIKRGTGGKWHNHAHSVIFTDVPIDYKIYDTDRLSYYRSVFGNSIPDHILDSIALNIIDIDGEKKKVSKLSLEWFKSTGDSINIDCRPIKKIPDGITDKKRLWKFRKMTRAESIAYQVNSEIMKYVYKIGKRAGSDAVEILAETHGFRFLRTYGDLYGLDQGVYEKPETIDTIVTLNYNRDEERYDLPKLTKKDFAYLDLLKDFQKKNAVLCGAYRKARGEALRVIESSRIASVLNEMKRSFRSAVAQMWEQYRKMTRSKEFDFKAHDRVESLSGVYSNIENFRDFISAKFFDGVEFSC